MSIHRLLAGAALAAIALGSNIAWAAPVYFQTNLASDITGLAPNVDPNLKNPWGMSFTNTSPFWLSDQVTNKATLYSGSGVPASLIVSMPTLPAGGPTGQVANGTSGFELTPGNPARFIFATLGGTIAGWNPTVSPTSSLTEFTAPDSAVYTGLAMGTANSSTFLYAADTRNGKIDVLDSSFHKTTLPGSFADSSIPAGFTPYNIQNVAGKLYVEYAKRNAPGGFVDVFDTSGNLLQQIRDSHFNSPWGVTLASQGFGAFGNDLLIGNFGDGTIDVFNPTSGAFIAVLSNSVGNPIVNNSLWALNFRAQGSGFDPNTLFFSAGINNEADGLFGEIQVVPEPGTLGTAALVLAMGLIFGTVRKQRA